MKLYLRLAWRNVWRHRRRTIIVVVAMGLTLAMMMFYDGLVAGFDDAIYGNAIKVLGGNIQIHASGYQAKADQTPLLPLGDDQAIVQAALALPQVQAATRRINTGGLASNREGAFPVSIIGVEPDKELPVSLVAQHVSAGRYLKADDQDVAYIGKGLAEQMNVQVGDRFTLVGRATHQQMRQRTMTVAGVYDVGMADVEKRTLYVSLAEAQNLYDLSGQSTEVVLTLKKLGQEQAVMNALDPDLPTYEISSWQTNFPELQQALATKGGGDGYLQHHHPAHRRHRHFEPVAHGRHGAHARNRPVGRAGHEAAPDILALHPGRRVDRAGGCRVGRAARAGHQRDHGPGGDGFQQVHVHYPIHGSHQRAYLHLPGAGKNRPACGDGANHCHAGLVAPGA